MHLDSHKIKRFAREKGFGLKKLLKIARVSPTAYYSLVRKESLLPKTIHALAQTLGVNPSEIISQDRSERSRYQQYMRDAESILKKYPTIDRENVLHTLILLAEPPLQRLNRGLRRAQNQSRNPFKT